MAVNTHFLLSLCTEVLRHAGLDLIEGFLGTGLLGIDTAVLFGSIDSNLVRADANRNISVSGYC